MQGPGKREGGVMALINAAPVTSPLLSVQGCVSLAAREASFWEAPPTPPLPSLLPPRKMQRAGMLKGVRGEREDETLLLLLLVLFLPPEASSKMEIAVGGTVALMPEPRVRRGEIVEGKTPVTKYGGRIRIAKPVSRGTLRSTLSPVEVAAGVLSSSSRGTFWPKRDVHGGRKL